MVRVFRKSQQAQPANPKSMGLLRTFLALSLLVGQGVTLTTATLAGAQPTDSKPVPSSKPVESKSPSPQTNNQAPNPAVSGHPTSSSSPANNSDRKISYGELLTKIDTGKVKQISIDEQRHIARFFLDEAKQDQNAKPYYTDLLVDNPELLQRIRANKIPEVESKPTPDNRELVGLLIQLFVVLFLIIGVILILRRSANAPGGPGQALNFGKSRARFQMEAKTGVTFDDVAGIEEAKEELQEPS
jgi:ATP-dependent Zn protease